MKLSLTIVTLAALTLVGCDNGSSSKGNGNGGGVTTLQHDPASCPDMTGEYIVKHVTITNGVRTENPGRDIVVTRPITNGVVNITDSEVDGQMDHDEDIIDGQSHPSYPDANDPLSNQMTYSAVCKNQTIEHTSFKNNQPFLKVTISILPSRDVLAQITCLNPTIKIIDDPRAPTFCDAMKELEPTGQKIAKRIR